MPEANADNDEMVETRHGASDPTTDEDDNKGGFLAFFKKKGGAVEEGVGAPASGAAASEPEDDTAPAGPEPIQFIPSAEAEKDPKMMVEEFRALVHDDLEDGGSVLVKKEHALAMAAYYRAMDGEVAKAARGEETSTQAGEHMTELTREELVEFWKKYSGIAFLCLAL